MPIYVTRGRYSAEAIRNLVANPEDRLPAVRNLVEAAGGRLVWIHAASRRVSPAEPWNPRTGNPRTGDPRTRNPRTGNPRTVSPRHAT